MKITVKNFQSLANATLDVEGFTVVTGRSNLGKSALVRAVRAAFFGLPGEYYVREGEASAGVAVVSPDMKLIWRKVPKPTVAKQTALQVNDATHTKLGKEHSSLTEVLGVRELITSTKLAITPQFAMQHDPVFLLTESETNVAEVFRLLGRTDTVTAAQAAAKKDRTGADNLLKVRGPDRDEAKLKVDELSHVPTLRMKVEDLRVAINQAEIKSMSHGLTIGRLKELQAIEVRTIPEPPVLTITDKSATINKLKLLASLNPRKVPDDVSIEQLKPQHSKSITGLKTVLALGEEIELIAQAKQHCWDEEADMEARRAELEVELGVCPTCTRSFGVTAHDH